MVLVIVVLVVVIVVVCLGFSVHQGGGVCHAFSLRWLHVVVLVIMVVDCHYVLVAVMVGYYGGWSYWLA